MTTQGSVGERSKAGRSPVLITLMYYVITRDVGVLVCMFWGPQRSGSIVKIVNVAALVHDLWKGVLYRCVASNPVGVNCNTSRVITL